MIKVIRNESFGEYYEIYENTDRIEEVQGRLKARRTALKLAKKLNQTFIIFLGESINVELNEEKTKTVDWVSTEVP